MSELVFGEILTNFFEQGIMTTREQQQLFENFTQAMYADIQRENAFPRVRPLLAHYTSIETLERMMATGEFWLAHPLYMNDVEELRFGINQGCEAFQRSDRVRDACRGEERYLALLKEFDRQYLRYANDEVLDTYVMCFSEHQVSDEDGRLSMWRGYGNNGSGAAIVFNTKFIEPVENSPMMLARVEYGTSAERLEWLNSKIDAWATLFSQSEIAIADFYLPVHSLFDRIKLFSLFSKHCGFKEEQEWRLVYMAERDRGSRLAHMLHYAVGKRGVEPRLKFKVGPVEGVAREMDLNDLVEQIILGPTGASQMAIACVQRMLTLVGREALCEKVTASTTPFRG